MKILPSSPTTANKEMFDDLKRLVEGIDRRVPRLDPLEEAVISRESAELRARAVSLMRAIDEASGRD